MFFCDICQSQKQLIKLKAFYFLKIALFNSVILCSLYLFAPYFIYDKTSTCFTDSVNQVNCRNCFVVENLLYII